MNLKPIANKILVELVKYEDGMEGGLFTPASARKDFVSQKAQVIALGTGNIDQYGKITPFEVKVNDFVIVNKFGGTEIKSENKKYLLVTQEDILGIIE